MCNQTACEDFTDYAKVHEMMEQTQNSNVRSNDDICGFDWRWDNNTGVGALTGGPTAATLPGIAAGQKRHVSFTPLSGLSGGSNSKHIPLKFAPLVSRN